MPIQGLNFLIKPASGRCNMRCGYCFYHSLMSVRSEEGRIMPCETAHTLIRRAYESGARSICFAFQGGEPTLAGLDFFRDFVDTAVQQNINKIKLDWAIQTNGLCVNEQWAAFFAENHFLVGLSIDGDKEIHDLLRLDAAGKGTYTRVLEAAHAMDRAGAEYNILCVISAQVARHGARVYNALKRNGFKFLQFIPCLDPFDGYEGQHTGIHSLTPQAYGTFLKTVFMLWYRDFMEGNYISVRYFDNLVNLAAGYSPEQCGMHGFCPGQFVVESDGGVYPCDFYVVPELKTGNIVDNSIEDILQSPVRQKFIEDSRVAAKQCGACAVYDLCRGGCRRDRQTGPEAPLTVTRFCPALKEFLFFARPYLAQIVKKLEKTNIH